MKKIAIKPMTTVAPSPNKKRKEILIQNPKRSKFKPKKSPFYLSVVIMLSAVIYSYGDDVKVINSSANPIPVAPYSGYSKYMSTAKEASHAISAVPANLVLLMVSSDVDQWILVMDSATVPADGAVTLLVPPIHVSAATTTMVNFPPPTRGSAGISVCNSNANSFTKTVGAANCIYYVRFQP